MDIIIPPDVPFLLYLCAGSWLTVLAATLEIPTTAVWKASHSAEHTTTFMQTTAPSMSVVNTAGEESETTSTTTFSPFRGTQSSVSANTYRPPYFVSTESPLDDVIGVILNETVTEDNVLGISDELRNVTRRSRRFNERNVKSVTSKLNNIAGFASERNLTEETVLEVSGSVIEAVDNILDISESTLESTSSDQQISTDILNTISTLTDTIQNTSTNNFTYSGSNIALAAVKVNRRRFPITTAIGRGRNDAIEFSANKRTPPRRPSVTSVALPESILQFVRGERRNVPINVFRVNSPKLFRRNRTSSLRPRSSRRRLRRRQMTSAVASPILTVEVGRARIRDLLENDSIVFVFPINQSAVGENTNDAVPLCVHWDNSMADWSEEGCTTDDNTLEDMVTCRCTHLTSFAVLLDVAGSIESPIIDVVSRIGCIASIVCLVLTLAILLCFTNIRRKQPQQILINLCFALLALYLAFVVGIDQQTWGAGCTVIAVLLHYFCLASVTWMGVEAFSMYLMFVRVMDSYIPKFLLKCSLLGWGFPILVVIATVASSLAAYENAEYCFIEPGPSLYFGLILPVGMILAFNGIIFAVVIYKLSCGRKAFSASSTGTSDKGIVAETIRRARNTVAIGTLLGLTWTFGFLAVGDGRAVFNSLFTVFNSLQGVFVFLLFGIRQPEVMEKLRRARARMLRGATSLRTRSSNFWASSSESHSRTGTQHSEVTLISLRENKASP